MATSVVFLNLFFFYFWLLSALSCGTWDLRCGMWDHLLQCAGSTLRHAGSSLRHAGFSLVVVCRFSLSSCGTEAPEHVGSVVVARGLCSFQLVASLVAALGLSCPAACGILVPQSGIEPTSPALEGRFFTTGPPGRSQHS